VNGGVGVFWSNQSATDHAFYFSVHPDGGAWSARETAYNPALGADGHLSVKTNTNGDVLAAVKTSQTGANPLIGVLRRTAGGTWESIHTVATSAGTPDPTRPILVIDAANNEADVFMTSQVDGGIITRRTAALSTLDFGAASSGTAFIQSTADPLISDATSTKQVATAESGIIVLASDRTETVRRYLHGCAGSVCPLAPTADFTGTPTTGPGPLNVAFTDISTGTPGTWAWTFGDGGTSALQNPSHTFNPGTWTVSLTVTNILGTNTMTKAGYITVSVPPGASYFPIAPIRVLDSRAGLGTNRFNANVAKDFQVTNGTSIPSNATAVTGNLTVTAQTAKGYIILAPTAGSSTSTLNFPVADNRANGVTVALSGTGKLNAVYKAAAGKTAHLLFDVTGYFLAGSSGASYFPISPIRVLDSRAALGTNRFNANVAKDFQVTNGAAIPSTAAAVTGNLTVTAQTAKGYIILAPTAGSSTSTLNFPIADNRANGVTVALSGTGKLNAVYKAVAGKTTHILFDVTGYFE
jgi:PKD repeat protein